VPETVDRSTCVHEVAGQGIGWGKLDYFLGRSIKIVKKSLKKILMFRKTFVIKEFSSGLDR
jgi:hypothetical protein